MKNPRYPAFRKAGRFVFIGFLHHRGMFIGVKKIKALPRDWKFCDLHF